MKYTIVFIVFVLTVVGLLFALSIKQYPRIPEDASHTRITDKAVCMECHGPDGEHAMQDSHPPKYECFKCHRAAK